MLDRDKLTENDIEKNDKACDTLEAREDLYCEKEQETVLKRLKIIRP